MDGRCSRLLRSPPHLKPPNPLPSLPVPQLEDGALVRGLRRGCGAASRAPAQAPTVRAGAAPIGGASPSAGGCPADRLDRLRRRSEGDRCVSEADLGTGSGAPRSLALGLPCSHGRCERSAVLGMWPSEPEAEEERGLGLRLRAPAVGRGLRMGDASAGGTVSETRRPSRAADSCATTDGAEAPALGVALGRGRGSASGAGLRRGFRAWGRGGSGPGRGRGSLRQRMGSDARRCGRTDDSGFMGDGDRVPGRRGCGWGPSPHASGSDLLRGGPREGETCGGRGQ